MKFFKSGEEHAYVWQVDKILSGLRKRFKTVRVMKDHELTPSARQSGATGVSVEDTSGLRFGVFLIPSSPDKKSEAQYLIFLAAIGGVFVNDTISEAINNRLKVARVHRSDSGDLAILAVFGFESEFSENALNDIAYKWLKDLETIISFFQQSSAQAKLATEVAAQMGRNFENDVWSVSARNVGRRRESWLARAKWF